jgi:hypothetical protein
MTSDLARSEAFEDLLARLYTNGTVLEAFVKNPDGICAALGIVGNDAESFRRIRPEALRRASRTYQKKIEYRLKAKPGWAATLNRTLEPV